MYGSLTTLLGRPALSYMCMHTFFVRHFSETPYYAYRSSILSEPVPDVLVQLITGFEVFLKNQKAESDLISKYSDTSMKKVLQDTTTQSQV